MTYYATFGEILLIIGLLDFSSSVLKLESKYPQIKYLVFLSILFIAITASFGAFRFAGFEQVIGIHDTSSWVSKHFAMLFYASGSAILFLDANKQNKLVMTVIILVGASLGASLSGNTLIIDIVLFVCLIMLSFNTEQKQKVWGALAVLLLVPLTSLLPVSEDLKMGVFHVLLGCHFMLMAHCFKLRVINQNKLTL